MTRNALRLRNKLGYMALALLLAGGMSARPASAESTLDFPISDPSYTVISFSTLEAVGQTFTAPADTLTDFTFYGVSATAPNLHFVVAPWDGTQAGGRLLEKPVAVATDSLEPVVVDTDDLKLTPGEEYVAFLVGFGGSFNPVGNRTDPTDHYSGGTFIYLGSNGWGSDVAGTPGPVDFAFRAHFLNDADGDGVDLDVDMCPNSDLRSHVDVDGVRIGHTGIKNTVDAVGCSIQDYVNAIVTGAKNKGQYLKGIQSLADELLRRKKITIAQHKEMRQDAAHFAARLK